MSWSGPDWTRSWVAPSAPWYSSTSATTCSPSARSSSSPSCRRYWLAPAPPPTHRRGRRNAFHLPSLARRTTRPRPVAGVVAHGRKSRDERGGGDEGLGRMVAPTSDKLADLRRYVLCVPLWGITLSCVGWQPGTVLVP